jgi:hypothetical protein
MKNSEPTQPAQSPTRSGGILWAFTGMFSGQSAAPAPSAPLAATLPDEPSAAVHPAPASFDEPLVPASSNLTSGSGPAVSATAPTVGVLPLPASRDRVSSDDLGSDSFRDVSLSGSLPHASASAASAPIGIAGAFAAAYAAGKKGDPMPQTAPATQSAPAASSTGVFERFRSLVISPKSGLEASAAAAPSPSPSGSSETPPAVRRSISEALAEGYRAGSTPKPEPVDSAATAGFLARLHEERTSPATGASSPSI